MASYSYRLPISVSFKKSSTAPVSLSSLKRSTTLSRAPRSLLRCPRFRLFPVILSTLLLRARHSRFHALHPPNKCPRVCFLPESHHQQASDSFFFIRTRWVLMRAWPEANWRKTAAVRCVTGMPGHGKVQVQGTSENWWSRVARGYGLVRGRTGTERCKPGTAGEPVYSDQWDKGRLTLIRRRHRHSPLRAPRSRAAISSRPSSYTLTW
jgi:hypothetical protein